MSAKKQNFFRPILRKWYIYKLPNSVPNYNPQFMTLIYQKKYLRSLLNR